MCLTDGAPDGGWKTIFDDLTITRVTQAELETRDPELRTKAGGYFYNPHTKKGEALISKESTYHERDVVCHEIGHHVLKKKGVKNDALGLEALVNELAAVSCDGWLK